MNVDTNQSDKLLRLLDTVVIKLEGGTDEDLKVLDEKPNDYRLEVLAKEPVLTPATATLKTPAPTATEPKADGIGENDEHDEDGAAVKEIESNATNDVNAADKPAKAEEKVSKKRKRTTSGSSSSSSSSTSSSGK